MVLFTFFKLVCQYNQKSHTDHEDIEGEGEFTQFAYSRPTEVPHHSLVCALATDRGGVAQDHQSTNEEYERKLVEKMANEQTGKAIVSK